MFCNFEHNNNKSGVALVVFDFTFITFNCKNHGNWTSQAGIFAEGNVLGSSKFSHLQSFKNIPFISNQGEASQ